MRCCNGWATSLVASSHEPADRCCNPRCAVATDGQPRWLRRRTNRLSAVATRDALVQRISNRVGCVVARTCGSLLQPAMRCCNGWATALVASLHEPAERCCNTRCSSATLIGRWGASRAADTPPLTRHARAAQLRARAVGCLPACALAVRGMKAQRWAGGGSAAKPSSLGTLAPRRVRYVRRGHRWTCATNARNPPPQTDRICGARERDACGCAHG